MDILSHGLWAIAVGKGATLEKQATLKAPLLLVWGMFPDLFAFVPGGIYEATAHLFGKSGSFVRPEEGAFEAWTPGIHSVMDVTQLLYSFSHSIVIFACVLMCIYLYTRRIPWVMLGWPLHILADVPTHTHLFFATPVFFPLFSWTFNGFDWGNSYFTLYNYIALVLVFTGFFLYTKYVLKRSTKHLFSW